MNLKSLEQTIRKWHVENNCRTFRDTIELGKYVIEMCMLTMMSENKCIIRIREIAGEYAKSTPVYNRAARIVRVLTPDQIAILQKANVAINRVEVLVARHYPPDERARIIEGIGNGSITSPWTFIKTRQDKRQMAQRQLAETSESNPDTVTVNLYTAGTLDEEKVVDVMKNIITKCGTARAKRLWMRSVCEVNSAIDRIKIQIPNSVEELDKFLDSFDAKKFVEEHTHVTMSA